MKKAIFLFLFCFSALYCFAQENLTPSANSQASPLYSDMFSSSFGFDGSLKNQASVFDHSTVELSMSTSSFGLEQMGFDITKYSDYYPTTSGDKWRSAKPALKAGLCIVGIVGIIFGPFFLGVNETLGWGFVISGSLSVAIATPWIIIDGF